MPYRKMVALTRKSAKPEVKMALPGTEMSQDDTKHGGARPPASERRLSCCLSSTATRTSTPRSQRRLAAVLPAVRTGQGSRRRRAPAAGTGAGSPAWGRGARLTSEDHTQKADRRSGGFAAPPCHSVPLCSRSRPARSRRALEVLSGLRRRVPPRKRPTAADPTSGSPGDRPRGSVVTCAKPSPSAPDWSSSNADNHIGQGSALTSGKGIATSEGQGCRCHCDGPGHLQLPRG
ncbi:uncharacterized protein LOC127470313 isoform X2 [Manacus candei]|nr:uncharacterized protein LOC127470313 isoform X2 [Manacus candei]